MKHYTQEVVPEHTKRVESHITCDGCGHIIASEVLDGPFRRTDEVKITRTVSEHCSGEYSAEHWSIDCCADCWDRLVLPLFPLRKTEPEYW